MQINRQGSLSVTAANANQESEARPAKARLGFMIPGLADSEQEKFNPISLNVITSVSTNRKVFISSRFYNKHTQRCKIWSSQPSLLSLFTFCDTIKIKKKSWNANAALMLKAALGV